jgi:MoaA/NifB/PqqE/SkfB family radical SAM enzyme
MEANMSERPRTAPGQPRRVTELPHRVLMDLATRCNLRCSMCPVWGIEDEEVLENAAGIMDLAASKRIMDEIMAAKPLMQPMLYGEPLLIPNFREQFRHAKERGITIALNTNGLTLTDEIAAFFIEIGIDSVFFSIDAVTKETLKKVRGIDKLEKLEAAVFRMLKARGDRDHPRIGVSFTLQDANRAEREAFVDRWVGVVDCVRVGLLFEHGTFGEMATPPVRTPCPALYETMAIHHDGTVTVCCLDALKQTNLGNVIRDGVKAVWQGEAFTQVRHYHETGQWDKVPFCEPCNGWAQYDFAEEVRDGLLIRRSPEYTYYNRIDRLKNWHGNLLGAHPAPALATEDATV